MQNTLIPQVLIEADIRENSEGHDQNVLREALQVNEAQLSKPMTADELLNKYL